MSLISQFVTQSLDILDVGLIENVWCLCVMLNEGCESKEYTRANIIDNIYINNSMHYRDCLNLGQLDEVTILRRNGIVFPACAFGHNKSDEVRSAGEG